MAHFQKRTGVHHMRKCSDNLHNSFSCQCQPAERTLVSVCICILYTVYCILFIVYIVYCINCIGNRKKTRGRRDLYCCFFAFSTKLTQGPLRHKVEVKVTTQMKNCPGRQNSFGFSRQTFVQVYTPQF